MQTRAAENNPPITDTEAALRLAMLCAHMGHDSEGGSAWEVQVIKNESFFVVRRKKIAKAAILQAIQCCVKTTK